MAALQLDAHFQTLVTQAGAPENFVEWLLEEQVTDAETYAMLCSTEQDVKTDIVAAFQTDTRKFKTIAEKTCAVKLWKLARAAMATVQSREPAAWFPRQSQH